LYAQTVRMCCRECAGEEQKGFVRGACVENEQVRKYAASSVGGCTTGLIATSVPGVLEVTEYSRRL
jgi:hypothetical protein